VQDSERSISSRKESPVEANIKQDSERSISSQKETPLEANIKQERRILGNSTGDIVPLLEVIDRAWSAGAKAWEELESAISQGAGSPKEDSNMTAKSLTEACPASVSGSGKSLDVKGKRFLPLPCGLMFGSAITIIGRPRDAHMEYKPPIARVGEVFLHMSWCPSSS